MSNNGTVFARWLLGELEFRGWKQSDLARRGKINSSLLSRILAGERPGDKTALAIAKALRVTPEFVFRVAGLLPPLQKSRYREELTEILNTLSETGIKLLIGLSEALQAKYYADDTQESSGNAAFLGSSSSKVLVASRSDVLDIAVVTYPESDQDKKDWAFIEDTLRDAPLDVLEKVQTFAHTLIEDYQGDGQTTIETVTGEAAASEEGKVSSKHQ